VNYLPHSETVSVAAIIVYVMTLGRGVIFLFDLSRRAF
jgi:hypothetical protein